MFTALLALAAVPPQVDPNVSGKIMVDDYPAWALDEGEQGTVGFELLIGPDGKAQRCTVLASSGFPQLDSYTCGLVQKRAVFQPLTTDQGQQAYAVFEGVINWSINGEYPLRRLAPDLELQVNGAPAGTKLPVDFDVAYLSSPTGVVSSCRSTQTDDKNQVPKQLVDLACKSLSQAPADIVRDLKGEPVTAWVFSSVRVSLDPRSRSPATPAAGH